MYCMNRNKILLILLVISVPVLINYLLMTWKAPGVVGDANSWLGFFANYSGGIIGGIVALYVARYQLQQQTLEQIKNEEVTKYINQLPALLKIKFELNKFKESVEKAYTTKHSYKEFIKDKRETMEEVEDEVIEASYKMYQLNEENWKDIGLIQDVDIQVSLIEIKNFYQDIQYILSHDLKESSRRAEHLEMLNRDSLFNTGFPNSEVLTDLREIEIELSHMMDSKKTAWEELDEKDFLNVVKGHIDIIDVAINVVREFMEKRADIRDS